MNKFAVVILTNGRPNKVFTHNTLRKTGYTGDIYLLVDDMDKCMNEYVSTYGDKVLSFSKSETVGSFDKMDNFGNMATVVYARNAVFDVCKKDLPHLKSSLNHAFFFTEARVQKITAK